MSSVDFNSRILPVWALRTVFLSVALFLSACVAPISIRDQAPKVPYGASNKIAVVVIDARSVLKEDKKSPTYIGRVHGLFGIPQNMNVYPWVALKDEKQLTLAQELEQR